MQLWFNSVFTTLLDITGVPQVHLWEQNKANHCVHRSICFIGFSRIPAAESQLCLPVSNKTPRWIIVPQEELVSHKHIPGMKQTAPLWGSHTRHKHGSAEKLQTPVLAPTSTILPLMYQTFHPSPLPETSVPRSERWLQKNFEIFSFGLKLRWKIEGLLSHFCTAKEHWKIWGLEVGFV